MRDLRQKATLLVTSPIWMTSGLICICCIGSAFLLLRISIIGGVMAAPLLLIAMPFTGVFCWAGMVLSWLQRDVLELNDVGIEIVGKSAKRGCAWGQIAKVVDQWDPPGRSVELFLTSGETVKLHLLSDTQALLKAIRQRGITLEVN